MLSARFGKGLGLLDDDDIRRHVLLAGGNLGVVFAPLRQQTARQGSGGGGRARSKCVCGLDNAATVRLGRPPAEWHGAATPRPADSDHEACVLQDLHSLLLMRLLLSRALL